MEKLREDSVGIPNVAEENTESDGFLKAVPTTTAWDSTRNFVVKSDGSGADQERKFVWPIVDALMIVDLCY